MRGATSISDEAFMDQARAAIDAYEAARTSVDVVELVGRLLKEAYPFSKPATCVRLMEDAATMLTRIAAERDAALAEEERMTVLLDGGDAELQTRLLKAEAERDAHTEVVKVANKVCTIPAQHGIVTRETRLDGVELYGWLRRVLADLDEELKG